MNGDMGGIEDGVGATCKGDGDGVEGESGRFLREFLILCCKIVRGRGVLGRGSEVLLETGGWSWWSRLGWREGMLRIGVVGDGGS